MSRWQAEAGISLANKVDHQLSNELFDTLAALLQTGKVRPKSVLQLKGRDKLPEGFGLYRGGKYLTQKMAYRVWP